MQDLLSVLFYVRKSRNTEATHATVYLRITYESKRAEASTMKKVPLGKWNSKANKVGGSSAEAKQVNRNLDIIKNSIYALYQRMLNNKEPISADKILDLCLGKSDFQKTILIMFDEHNDKLAKLVGKDYSFRTLQRYSIKVWKILKELYSPFIPINA